MYSLLQVLYNIIIARNFYDFRFVDLFVEGFGPRGSPPQRIIFSVKMLFQL